MCVKICTRFIQQGGNNMRVVRAIFDGQDIKPIDPVTTKKKSEVLVIFPNDVERLVPEEARKLLRGSGKGERLTEKLLKSRIEDLRLERR
jgi:hypothetical protein